jgi:hypothetical protein
MNTFIHDITTNFVCMFLHSLIIQVHSHNITEMLVCISLVSGWLPLLICYMIAQAIISHQRY